MKRIALFIALSLTLVMILAPLMTPVAAQTKVIGPTDREQ